DAVLRRLREQVRPEFVNRIDEIVIFRRLESEQLEQITDLMLEQTRRRMRSQGITVQFTEAAVRWLVEHGYGGAFGPRPMRRTIQREVDNRLSSMLLEGELNAGQQVTVDVQDGRLTFAVERSPEPARAW